MHELAPDHVAGAAIFVLAALADAGTHLGFHVLHRAIDRITERFENPFVASRAVENGDALGHVEVEIVAHRAVGSLARRQLLAGFGVDVVAERIPLSLLHVPLQAKTSRSRPAPTAGEFLALGIVVRGAVVTLRAAHMRVLRDPQHIS